MVPIHVEMRKVAWFLAFEVPNLPENEWFSAIFFFAAPQVRQDFSFPTRDQTHALCSLDHER